jgi:hypothetical protein
MRPKGHCTHLCIAGKGAQTEILLPQGGGSSHLAAERGHNFGSRLEDCGPLVFAERACHLSLTQACNRDTSEMQGWRD